MLIRAVIATLAIVTRGSAATSAPVRTAGRYLGGNAEVGQRRPAEGRAVARPDRAHRRVEAPVDGPVMVRRLNIDGDGQGDLGGHGGEQRAVFVYQLDSYRYWQEFLGRDDFSVRPVRGELHRRRPARRRGVHRRPVPDRRGAVRGHPAARHLLPGRHPDGRPADAGAAGAAPPARASTSGCSTRARSGPGDEIVKVAAGPERMTVAEVDALLYLPGHPADADRAGAAHPGAQPGLAGVVPGDARRAGVRRAATPASSPPRRRRPGPGSARCG